MPYSILLVDDEEIIRRTLSLDLKDAGYEVTQAASGEEAIARLKERKFEMVITDLMMEGLDGIQVLKEGKKEHSALLVLILTGYGSLTTAIDALRLGASDYVLKPYDKDEILLRITNCLEKMELKKKVELYENVLPLCCMCKKIRDGEPGKGKWLDIDAYLLKNANVGIDHGYCEECREKKKGDIYLEKQKKDQNMKRLAK